MKDNLLKKNHFTKYTKKLCQTFFLTTISFTKSIQRFMFEVLSITALESTDIHQKPQKMRTKEINYKTSFKSGKDKKWNNLYEPS